MNVNDGKVFLRKSGSAVGDTIKEFVTLDHEGILTGSLNISGSVTASYFKGDGSQLTNISDITKISNCNIILYKY